ncbi:Di-copper centre-containing protein [Mycena rosella]|uniref:Di-copper centre-containing protein n=1 Tax=Mycena rosella TaxID=1033263 RepID=A0AAD7DM13_MYCRO|nr:Di-copper centre-containing protein [Mycena rosella]
MPSLLTVCFALIWLLALAGGTEVKCTRPAVRKEWRSLSHKEQEHWISAFKCVADLPGDFEFSPTVNPPDIAPFNDSGSLFDDYVYAHMDLNHHIHFTGLFFPWHRWYLHSFEQVLRNRCGYRGAFPYWDWTQDAADFYGSAFFQDSSPKSGLGGWGDASTQLRVLDGAFSASSSFRVSYPFPHTLRRNFTLFPPLDALLPVPDMAWKARPANASFTKPVVESLIDGFVGDFKGFQAQMEGPKGPHPNVHLIIGGDMSGQCPVDAPAGCVSGPTFSPNDPLFFLHHAMVDRIWFKWQRKHKLNKHAFAGGSVQQLDNVTVFSEYPTGGPPFLTMHSEIPTNGLAPVSYTVSDMMSTTEGSLCYVYE